MHMIIWLGCGLGVLAGAIEFLTSLVKAESAPQQAAGAAMAIAWVVIPYVFARFYDELTDYHHRLAQPPKAKITPPPRADS